MIILEKSYLCNECKHIWVMGVDYNMSSCPMCHSNNINWKIRGKKEKGLSDNGEDYNDLLGL